MQSPFKDPQQQPSDDFFFDESYFDILLEPQQAVKLPLREDREKTRVHIRTTGIVRSDAELQATSQCLRRIPSRSQLQSGVQSNTTNQPYPPPVFFERTSNTALQNQQTNQEMKTNNAADVDVLAEFESWLESGAVDIV